MAIERRSDKRREIDIDGSAGNAWALMGLAQDWSRQIGIDYEPIQEEMMSGDYIHLLKVFDKYFGSVVTLVTENEVYLKALGEDHA